MSFSKNALNSYSFLLPIISPTTPLTPSWSLHLSLVSWLLSSKVVPLPPLKILLVLQVLRNRLLLTPASALLVYDTLSANVVKSFPKLAKSESGQIVSEKVKLTYFDVYLSHTMWNHTKNSMKGLKQPTSVFLQWEVTDWQELFAKNAENKGN